MRLHFDKEIAEIYSAFDETLIHNAPNEEMEEPFHPQDMENHAVPLNPTDNTGEVVSGPHKLKNAEIYLPRGDRNEIAKILGRKHNPEGLHIGRKHSNLRSDSRIFTVEFSDGEQQEIAYNILQNISCTHESTWKANNTVISLSSLIIAKFQRQLTKPINTGLCMGNRRRKDYCWVAL